MSRFFIHRPVFAGVIAIIIVLAGLVAAKLLAVAQYPEIAPPTVLITTTYPGASAETLAKTVAAPIEEQLSGVERLSYFSSSSSSNGSLSITVTFEPGTNVDQAVFNVNNRVQIALPRLPDEVRRNGVIVQKRSFDILLVVALISPNNQRDTLFLSNFASLNVVRASGPSGVLRLKDIARIEMGALNYDTYNTLDGKPTIGMATYLQPGANALEVAQLVRDRMAELKAAFPEGVDYTIPFDTTRFVDASIREVTITIFEAAALVLGVVFLFLQTWRATLIPMIAVPVSLIGAFAGLWLAGFSINTLTLFALVLAIGIVVDDAIVVLENVERLMREDDMPPFEAALEAMREVSGAVIAIVLVLCAVFVPVAFLGGIAGQLYRQFAVTLTFAVMISGFIALTLTPALCAILMKKGDQHSRVFEPFNRGFAWVTRRFLDMVQLALEHRVASMLAFLGVIGLAAGLFLRVPGSFVPPEDQGYLFATVQLPDGATLERTRKMSAELGKLIGEQPAVQNVLAITGFDLIGGGNKTNAATMFVPLKHWDERKDNTAPVVARSIIGKASGLREGVALAFNPAAIRGLGTAGGLEGYLQARGDSDPARLYQVTGTFMGSLAQHPLLAGINSFYRPTVPQLKVEVDREKAMSLGVPVQDVFDALQSTMSALYVNDFNKFGRTYRVQMQAEAPFRAEPEDLGSVYVRSSTTREMIPLKALIRTSNVVGPEQLERFNGFLAAKVLGGGKPGVSSGEAIKAVEEVADSTLPEGYKIAWTGQAFQEKRTGRASAFAFSLAIVMVFLILAALYERWLLPFAVVLAVPFAVAGALGFVALRGLENDIYFQIGLVVLIGLAAKNAILIVEFAQQGFLQGKSPVEAALHAARLRFRPIIMTSLAFVLGVMPLMVSTGAGAAARRSMGTGVVGGMLAATFIATVFVPLFFVLVARRPKTRRVEAPA